MRVNVLAFFSQFNFHAWHSMYGTNKMSDFDYNVFDSGINWDKKRAHSQRIPMKFQENTNLLASNYFTITICLELELFCCLSFCRFEAFHCRKLFGTNETLYISIVWHRMQQQLQSKERTLNVFHMCNNYRYNYPLPM